jgi:hypothetical protein
MLLILTGRDGWALTCSMTGEPPLIKASAGTR